MEGYADHLHQHLRAQASVGPLLSADPLRGHDGHGPIYVQSHAPTDPTIAASGPDRLGAWSAATGRTITTEGAPLVTEQGDARIAHIALVYADLEERTAKVGSALEAAARSLVSLGQYATMGSLIHMLVQDVAALGAENSPARGLLHRSGHPTPCPPTPSLGVRTDPGAPTAGRAPAHEDGSGVLATVRQIENDVAAYVCRNDLRTRVRGFVRDALCRLAYRADVAAFVVNAHSNGTPIAYDVLRELTPNAIGAVRALLTAGSPLRKYADLVTWGTEIGNLARITPLAPYTPWLNLWDPRDPVADPLEPGPAWRPGQPPEQVPPDLFHVGDARATSTPAPVHDYQVDNLSDNHGAGLRAHNYWDNTEGFVGPLSDLLTTCVEAVGTGVTTRA
jgi:hypothetical protein